MEIKMQKAGVIEHINACSRDQFYIEYIRKDKPVIITGIANRWPACSKWSIPYFDKQIGDLNIKYRYSTSRLHPDLTKLNIHSVKHDDVFKQGSLQYFLNQINTNKKNEFVFLCASGLPVFSNGQYNKELKPLLDDIEIPQLFMSNMLRSSGLWISPKNIVSWLHYDKNGLHNLNAQIQGQKRVLLFSPQEMQNYYLCPDNPETINYSQIDITNPDYNKYPLFKKSFYYEGILNAGEILYIPAYWLHSFEHLGDVNINLNYWWDEQITSNNPFSKI